MDTGTWQTADASVMGIVLSLAIPWRHVVANYLARGDRWR